ncbi:hypothetical protein B0H13DRAFT_2457367, partial [Mycena leptocephala]
CSALPWESFKSEIHGKSCKTFDNTSSRLFCIAPVCGLLCPLTLFPVCHHARLILCNAAFTNKSAMEQDVGKVSALAQMLQRILSQSDAQSLAPPRSAPPPRCRSSNWHAPCCTTPTARASIERGSQGHLDVLGSTLCSPRGPSPDAPLR